MDERLDKLPRLRSCKRFGRNADRFRILKLSEKARKVQCMKIKLFWLIPIWDDKLLKAWYFEGFEDGYFSYYKELVFKTSGSWLGITLPNARGSSSRSGL